MGGREDGASVNFSRLMYEYDHGSIDFILGFFRFRCFCSVFQLGFGAFWCFLVRFAVPLVAVVTN